MYNIMHMPSVIPLGITGEKGFRQIQIDMRPWMIIVPGGVPSIVHIRPGETAQDAYVAATTFEHGILTWEPSAGDLGTIEGYGMMEVWMEREENSSIVKRGKSVRCQTFVRGSIAQTAGEDTPEAQEAWLEQMTALKTAIENSNADACAALAGDYDDLTFPVKAGQLCWHSGTLYRAKVDIASSENWTESNWAQAVIGKEFYDLKNSFTESALWAQTKDVSLTSGNIASGGGTSTSNTRIRNVSNSSIAFPISAGDFYWIEKTYAAQLFIFDSPIMTSSHKVALCYGGEYRNGIIAIPHEYVGKYAMLNIAKVNHETDDISSEVSGIGDYVKYYVPSKTKADLDALDAIAVKFTAQTLTESQKDIARTNIGSADATIVSSLTKKVGLTVDITGQFTFTDGKRINYVTGATNNEAITAYSKYVNVETYDKIKLTCMYMKNDYVTGLAFYSENNVDSFISGVKNHYNTSLEVGTYEVREIAVPAAAKYVRVSWWATITEEYAETPFGCYGIVTGEDEGNEDEAVDPSVISQLIKKVGISVDISKGITFTQGKRINYMNGKANSESMTAASNYINVEQYDAIRLTRMYMHVNYITGLAFYSEKGESFFIGGRQNSVDTSLEKGTYEVTEIAVPQGAKFMRTSWWATDRSEYGEVPFACFGIVAGEKTEVNLLPDYYFADDYIQGKIETILSHRVTTGSAASPMMEFIWFTDPHYYRNTSVNVQNGMQGVNIAQYVAQKTNIRHIICGGDLLDGTPTQAQALAAYGDVLDYLSPVWDRLHFIIGNHEWNNADDAHAGNQLGVQDIYNIFCKDKEKEYGGVDAASGSYYIDDPINKVRTIFLSCNYKSSIPFAYLQWLYNTLKSIPSGWAVLVCSHNGLANSGETVSWNGNFQYVAGMLDALHEETTYTISISASYTINCDFTGANVTVIGALTGHYHQDLYKATEHGVPVIGTVCDRGPKSNSSAAFVAARKYGTINEQAYDVVQIDLALRKIYLTRIGGSYFNGAPLENPDREYDFTGPQGAASATITAGAQSSAGGNVPSGGTDGQMLVKDGSTDYATKWANAPSAPVQDVQVNGTSILSNGVANVPVASSNTLGVAKVTNYIHGLQIDEGMLKTYRPTSSQIKAGSDYYRVIVPSNQHESTFYGLAKAAGDTSQSSSSNAVGTYTETAIDKILTMLGVFDLIASHETNSVASKAYTQGACFIYMGKLYRATADIALSDAITPGTNCEQTTLIEEINR